MAGSNTFHLMAFGAQPSITFRLQSVRGCFSPATDCGLERFRQRLGNRYECQEILRELALHLVRCEALMARVASSGRQTRGGSPHRQEATLKQCSEACLSTSLALRLPPSIKAILPQRTWSAPWDRSLVVSKPLGWQFVEALAAPLLAVCAMDAHSEALCLASAASLSANSGLQRHICALHLLSPRWHEQVLKIWYLPVYGVKAGAPGLHQGHEHCGSVPARWGATHALPVSVDSDVAGGHAAVALPHGPRNQKPNMGQNALSARWLRRAKTPQVRLARNGGQTTHSSCGEIGQRRRRG